jgi:hypothetical protein
MTPRSGVVYIYIYLSYDLGRSTTRDGLIGLDEAKGSFAISIAITATDAP